MKRAIDSRKPKNVILIIGDGMGDSEITVARNYLKGAGGAFKGIDALPLTGQMTHYSVNKDTGKPDYTPDSAATGTAWATGVKTYDNEYFPGMGIHEMGTARMGRDPKTSVLNSRNQVWDAPNVFVTDGSCMASAACVNPSLTYMALTARAADFAVNELNRRNL